MNKLHILYEDEWMFGFYKPWGMVVNRAESVENETMQDLVEHMYPELFSVDDEVFLKRSGMVHRLDKDTSGVILWSKTPESMYSLMGDFKNRNIHKTYQALVYGSFSPPTGTIRLPIARHPMQRKKFWVDVDGKPSLTEYDVYRAYSHSTGEYSLLTLHPVTGRTHQLRVHLRFLGFPIVGDVIYASERRLTMSQEICKRLFLHAKHIQFDHPFLDKQLSIHADLDDELQETLELLEDTHV